MTSFLVIALIIGALLEEACDNTIYLESSKLSNLFSSKSFAFQFVSTPDASNCLLKLPNSAITGISLFSFFPNGLSCLSSIACYVHIWIFINSCMIMLWWRHSCIRLFMLLSFCLFFTSHFWSCQNFTSFSQEVNFL